MGIGCNVDMRFQWVLRNPAGTESIDWRTGDGIVPLRAKPPHSFPVLTRGFDPATLARIYRTGDFCGHIW